MVALDGNQSMTNIFNTLLFVTILASTPTAAPIKPPTIQALVVSVSPPPKRVCAIALS